MNLMDILSGAGYALETPGALLRGAMTPGRFGERATGLEMLQGWGLADSESGIGADIGGMGLEMVLDPLAIAAPALAAAKGYGSYRSALARLGEMADAADELPQLAGLAGKFDQAADAQYLANLGHADEFSGMLNKQFGPMVNPVPDSEVWGMLPNQPELEMIAKRASMGGARRTDSLSPTGLKQYTKFEPELARAMEATGLGSVNEAGVLQSIPNIRHDASKGPKAIANPLVDDVRAGKAIMNPDFEGIQPPMQFPELPYEGMLREAGSMTAAREQALQALLSQDPTLMMELIQSGVDSPLARAILGGVGAGGAYAVGNQLFGDD